MIKQELRDYIAEQNPEAVVFDDQSYDNSIIGISDTDCVVYSLSKMIEELMDEEGWTYEESLEWIEYNTIRSIGYFDTEYPPIVVDDTTISMFDK